MCPAWSPHVFTYWGPFCYMYACPALSRHYVRTWPPRHVFTHPVLSDLERTHPAPPHYLAVSSQVFTYCSPSCHILTHLAPSRHLFAYLALSVRTATTLICLTGHWYRSDRAPTRPSDLLILRPACGKVSTRMSMSTLRVRLNRKYWWEEREF
jgi:hypothetical protein